MTVLLNDQVSLVRQQRGNLNTRFRKLSEDGSTYAAIILAVSGLERMNWHHLISEVSQLCAFVSVTFCLFSLVACECPKLEEHEQTSSVIGGPSCQFVCLLNVSGSSV